MIFSFFDAINYTPSTISKTATATSMTDIFRNYKGYFDAVIPSFTLRSYYIQGAPRPEYLAYQLYGNSQFYWVLLFCNGIYDPFHGWIKTQQATFDSADQAYANIGGNQVLYHIDINGTKYYNLVEYPQGSEVWYDKGDTNYYYPQYSGALAPVDIYGDFAAQNEEKRQIKIISPDDIESFISAMIREMEKAPTTHS